MAGDDTSGIKLETWLLIGFIVAMLLSTTVIVATLLTKLQFILRMLQMKIRMFSTNKYHQCEFSRR